LDADYYGRRLPRRLAAAGLIEADLERFHALWHDGASVCFAPLLVSSWARKPASAVVTFAARTPSWEQ
jgi:hypothetical protein